MSKAKKTRSSNNNTTVNPFAIAQDDRVIIRDAFVPQGTYSFRVITMSCWTCHKNGTEHKIPALGLILGMTDRSDRRQVKITLMCPQNNPITEVSFIKKVNAVLEALEMSIEDFYNHVDKCPGDALKDRQHPANPVGKLISLHVAPVEYPVRDKDGFIVTRKRFENVAKRDLYPNESFRFEEVEDGVITEVLCRKNGNYRLIDVVK